MSYIIQSTPCKACNRNTILRSVFVWTGKNEFEYATCGGVFFLQWTKKSPFSKISGHVWKRPESVKKKTTTRKSLQFVRKKSGYSSKKRMDDSLKNVGLPYTTTKMSRVWIHRKGPQLILSTKVTELYKAFETLVHRHCFAWFREK